MRGGIYCTGGQIRIPLAGDLTFTPSPDHATVTNYQVEVVAQGTTTPILASYDLWRPSPNETGNILVNIAPQLSLLPAGNYDVIVRTISPGGSADAIASNAFTVPLVAL